jgi:lipopolysaccharide export system protein LptA
MKGWWNLPAMSKRFKTVPYSWRSPSNSICIPQTKTQETPKRRIRSRKLWHAQGVEYTAGDRKAFADKAVYTADDDILVLTGESARLLTGTSWVTGTRITLFRKEDRAMVESEGSTRVQALFNPDDKPAAQ